MEGLAIFVLSVAFAAPDYTSKSSVFTYSIAGHAEVKGFQLKGMRVEEILNAKDS